jgi:hypothetical protein
MNYNTIFIDGTILWKDTVFLTILSIVLFIAGLAIFEGKDL